MSTMTYKGFAARVEYSPDDEAFVGQIAGINDIVGFHADTVAGLTTAFHEAVDDYIEACASAGKTPEKSFSGRVMFRVAPEVHAAAAKAAELTGVSLNEWAETALRDAAAKIISWKPSPEASTRIGGMTPARFSVPVAKTAAKAKSAPAGRTK